jgi:DNA-binding protein
MIRAQMLALEIPIQDIKIKAEEINSQITKSMQNKLGEIGKFK